MIKRLLLLLLATVMLTSCKRHAKVEVYQSKDGKYHYVINEKKGKTGKYLVYTSDTLYSRLGKVTWKEVPDFDFDVSSSTSKTQAEEEEENMSPEEADDVDAGSEADDAGSDGGGDGGDGGGGD